MAEHVLDEGRKAFSDKSWAMARARLLEADRQVPLEPEDLERLGMAAYLAGRADGFDYLVRAFNVLLSRNDKTRAARCAFWVVFGLLNRGERAQAAGWAARGQRLLDEGQHDCVEQGYLLLPLGLQSAASNDVQKAEAIFAEAAAIGERFRDPDLTSLGRQGHGRALIKMGERARGLALLDEVMVAATAGELSPLIAGVVYCSAISACFEIFDMSRAQEWTEALTRFCSSQPDLVPYRGECLVHRAEILLLRGAWPAALNEAKQACERLADSFNRAPRGAACYQLAEVRRLRGEFAEAEEAFRQASEAGRNPQPGLALLRLAQGRTDAAKAAVCRLLDETTDLRARSRALAAYIEISIALGDITAARSANDELAAIVATLDIPFLNAAAARAEGAVLLAEGDARAALVSLRRAWSLWRELESPYEAARANVLIGSACLKLGDIDSGQLEHDAARRVFQELGAAPDLVHLDRLSGVAVTKSDGGLTSREIEVLRLVASGRTNRAIADELAISEKTVARHLSNIFTKLDLSSRAAATAYAFQHHLV